MREFLSSIIAFGKGTIEAKSAVLVISGLMATVFGGWDMAMRILLFAVVIDFITGLMAGAYEGKLSSAISFRGIFKKFTIFLIVAIAFQLDCAMNMHYIKQTVIYFYIAMEALSVLENASRMDVPLPPFLKDLLNSILDKTSNGEINNNAK